MSNLPLQLAVVHNDDNDDEQTNNNKLSTINSRITSPLIIKRQQNNETKIANNQAYDEIHDVQSKHSSTKKSNNDNSYVKSQSKLNNSHELMQGNYYDQTRFDVDYSSSSANLRSEPVPIDINLEDYKKTIAPFSTSKNSSNKNRSSTPPFGDTSESIQHGIAQSAGILLELNKKPPHHTKTSSMKNNTKFHERAVINYFPKDTNEDDDNTNNKQRSLSSSSTSDCSTSDSSTSINCREESDKINSETNIPYEKLLNDEDDDDLIELPKKPLTESTTLLNKNLSQTYGTQSTTNAPYERGKYLSNNGYNSHGSSITTKSSSDNSGSIRTNSGSDNDEESDEEHYNNSTLSNNPVSMSVFPCTNDTSIKSLNKSNDIGTNRYDDRFSFPNEQNSYQLVRSNPTRSEQIGNNDEHHLQVPRFKQHSNDDPSGNNNKINSGTDHNILPYTSKWSLQQPSIDQTNNLLSSSQQNRNLIEQQPHSNSSRNNSRQHQIRATKKRKQSQQQETIRTELIPGHRGDLDVDELVMFIDGNSSKQQQNSIPLRSIDPTTKPKQNSPTDINSNKNSSRKKSRKSIKIVQQSISSINTNENTTSNYLSPIQQDIQSINFIDEDEQTTIQPIVDITNQSLRHRNVSSDNNNDDITSRISLPNNNNNNESRLNTVVSDSTNNPKMTNGGPSLPDWFEQTRNTSLQHDEDGDSFFLSSSIANNLNSEITSEPFVTVTHRRRPIKERRPDNNLLSRSSRFPPPSFSSSTMNDKRRIQSTLQNGVTHPRTRNSLLNIKPFIPSTSRVIKGENNISTPHVPETSPPPPTPPLPPPQPSSSSFVSNTINEQSSPRLSSHSSSSSLSSLLKRQSKPPPVVFLNKSVDIELNDVSFGFDLDSTTLNKSSDDINNNKRTTTEIDIDPINTSTSPSAASTQPNEISTDSPPQKYIRNSMGRSFQQQQQQQQQQQRNNRGPQFYSGSDIRPHHRNYPTHPVPQPPYIDPLLLLQYNQQRLASYNQQVAYMNLLRTQYLSQQPQYVLLPTTYTTTAPTNETDPDEKPLDDETSPSSEQVQEPLLVYTTPTGQVYFQPASTRKSFTDIEQQQQPTSIPTIYPPQFFYPPQQHLIPSHPAYFQPIPSSSSSLLIDTKSEQNSVDHDDTDHENSTKLYPQRSHQSSSDIMSNALQLVYSQQRRNAQTDRFNLDDLTAYLAVKWTEAADHYEQGDSRILLVDEQK